MTDEDMPYGYQRSRSALRRKFGQRAIDASAPYASGKGPVGNMPGAMGGKTPQADWRRFFDRPERIDPGITQFPPSSVSAFPEMGMETGLGKSDPSQAFRMAGAPPIGGPATGRSNLTQMGMDLPMAPAARPVVGRSNLTQMGMDLPPIAKRYYDEGIKGAGGLVDFGNEPTPSGFFTSTPYGPIGVSNKPKDAGIADFFKRYKHNA